MKSVRTKNNKTERVEIRCTKAFKEMINEIAVQNDVSVSQLIESICTEKIMSHLKECTYVDLKSKNADMPITARAEYEREIWRMLEEGRTPTETACWLNENGFKPQRGDKFTMNSVHSIRTRLKKKNK